MYFKAYFKDSHSLSDINQTAEISGDVMDLHNVFNH